MEHSILSSKMGASSGLVVLIPGASISKGQGERNLFQPHQILDDLFYVFRGIVSG